MIYATREQGAVRLGAAGPGVSYTKRPPLFSERHGYQKPFARGLGYRLFWEAPVWERWIGNRPDDTVDDAVLWIYHAAKRWGCRVDMHLFVRADEPGFFHSHLGYAIRVVLAGGYVEELFDPSTNKPAGERTLRPGHIGLVRPTMVHRVSKLLGTNSTSLWLRGPVTHPIKLYGEGYQRALAGSPFHTKDENGVWTDYQVNS